MTDHAMRLLKASLHDRAAANKRIEELLKREFAPGTAVSWRLSESSGLAIGLVTRNCYGDRLEVENVHTGKRRFIRAYQLR
ncbi:hypothetical protein [Afipia felis]|uniref:Uncharacterized protein n=2 Tax=Afipia felis TaxID=1035 RepID=A0A381AZH5_AFIFE|nr:hypothetical protein [Afipia felis]EKS26510.1 hypothetical protein HMPREF9697_04036 [Afipia felis ATCC 53690]SUU76156.1 Uncharacterised protein [Afipia felis]SUU84223.1 Uncharacterised protein [Afipia felis]SUW28205.1 Uncharacterised protein [Afipia felis]